MAITAKDVIRSPYERALHEHWTDKTDDPINLLLVRTTVSTTTTTPSATSTAASSTPTRPGANSAFSPRCIAWRPSRSISSSTA